MANDATSPATGAGDAPAAGGTQYAPDELKSRAGDASPHGDVNLDLVLDVPVNVSLSVGATDMSIRDLVRLVEGSVVQLDRQADEPMDVLVNGTLVARGEIVVVDDRFGVRLTEVVSPLERIQKIG